MAQAAYGNGFFGLFVLELEARHWPRYPEPSWFSALRCADGNSRVEAVRRTVEHRPTGIVYCYQYERHEVLAPGDRSPEIREFDRHCSAFLLGRGLPASDFHRY